MWDGNLIYSHIQSYENPARWVFETVVKIKNVKQRRFK